MAAWFRRQVQCQGALLLRGSFPFRPEDFAFVGDLGVTMEPLPAPEWARWSVRLRHAAWGEAELVAGGSADLPPRTLVEGAYGLTDDEREELLLAGSTLLLRMAGERGHVLGDRKLALRFLHALLGPDGVGAADMVARRVWSRGALADELAHEADLDIEGLYSLHAVSDESDGRIRWLHTHGLAELGALDFDILDPSAFVVGLGGADLIRCLAFASVEKSLVCGRAFRVAGGELLPIAAADFQRRAAPEWQAARPDPDGYHAQDRVVLCEPTSWLSLRRALRPAGVLSRDLDGEVALAFSKAATELTAERARGTLGLLCRVAAQVAELDVPVLVKLGFPTDGGGAGDREHLWFQAHELQDDSVEATLLSEPWRVARLRAGERGVHPIELLTDWMVPTPLGPVTPRDTSVARHIERHPDEARAAMAAAAASD